MKRLILYAVLLCVTMVSCEIETSNNGDLDGYWQLISIDSIPNGHSTDMKREQVFWAVQCDLLQAVQIGQNQVLFRFNNTGDSLYLYNPYKSEREKGDVKVTDVTLLRPLGINNIEEHFRFVILNHSTMILESQTLRLHFRKY